MTARIAERARGVRPVLAGMAAVAMTATLLAAGPAAADPGQPATVEQAKAQVEQLETEAAAIDQQYAAAQERVAKAEQTLRTKRSDVEAQRGRVETVRTAVAAYALSQYQSHGVDSTTELMLTADPDAALRQLSVRDRVELSQRGALQDYQTQVANLNDMARSAEAEVATVEKAKSDMDSARVASQAKVDQAQRVLAQLTEQERQRMAAEQERQAREAQQAAEQAQQADEQTEQTDQRTTSRSRERTAPEQNEGTGAQQGSPATTTPAKKRATTSTTGDDDEPVAASGKGAQVVSFARAQLGKPYGYGSTGPGAYDCSGLTGAAYRSAGRSIPRTSQAQFGSGTPVSKSALQPGDLVFYYSGISHVGVYVGGGQIIHASRPGKPIGYASLDSMPYMGARRY